VHLKNHDRQDPAQSTPGESSVARGEDRWAIFDHVATGLATVGMDGRFTRVNATFAGFIGCRPGELVGTDLGSIIHPDHRAEVSRLRDRLIAGEIPNFVTELRYRVGSGRELWVRSSVSLIRDAAGTPVETIAVVEDIDERVRLGQRREILSRADHALASSALDIERMLRSIAEIAVPELADFCFFDLLEPDETLRRIAWLHADPAKAEHFDTVHRMVPPLALDGHPVAHALRSNQQEFVPVMTDSWMQNAAMNERHLAFMRSLDMRSLVTIPLAVGDRRIAALTFAVSEFSGRTFDETDLDLFVQLGRRAAVAVDSARLYMEAGRARAAAEAARMEAEKANRAKSEFLAVMSHELRTPLNAIGGYVQLIDLGVHGPVTDAQRTALSRVQYSQQHLLGLINEVLNYARLEGGSVHYDIDNVAVRHLLQEMTAMLEPQAASLGLAMSIAECPPGLAVRADADKLRQVLLNLLTNALKFTAAGGRIEMHCRREADRVRIAVADTGIGISAEKLQAVFEPFVQVRSELTREKSGAGLGLAISRDLARGMGGDLEVESTPGEGSVFTVTLPASPQRTT
jgi:PAS domain S-box-containing protein